MDINNADSNGATSAVSIFGQGQTSNDFPVLKAFQEYIDAEQAKARKRMLGLSIFFVVLLVIVVVTFTVIVAGVINRNQSLQDRLLEAAFRQQQAPVQAQPVVTVQQPQSAQPDMRPVLDRIEQLTSAIASQPRQAPVQPAPSVSAELKPVLESIERLTSAVARPQAVNPAPVVVAPMAAPAAQPDEKTLQLKKQLERERAQLAAERKKLKDEQHQAEVERNRRRLYPEYYAKLDAEKGAAKTAAPSPSVPKTVAEAGATPSREKTPAPLHSGTGNLDDIKPVGYFDKNAADEDAELAAIAAQAAKRKAASEAARKQAEADGAEAAKRRAASETARKQAEADEAEAAKRKAAANAAKRKAEADSAEAAKAKAAAQAAKAKSEASAAEAVKRKAAADADRKRMEAELAETKRATAEADKRKAEAAKLKAEREFPPPPATETISVGGKESSMPWIIQRLSD